MNVTLGKVLKYSLLPGVVPRLRDFFGSGFSYIALFMALAYQAVRLLPPYHAYLRPENVGRYGMRHVMAEARRNLVYRRENIDQIVIYYTVLAGLFLLFFQFVAVIVSLTIGTAAAASAVATWYSGASLGTTWSAFFTTPAPSTDLAFRLMDKIFCLYGTGGAPPVFNSMEVTGAAGPPPYAPTCTSATAFYNALHRLFNFYNLGILVVGLIIFFYLIVTVIAETAQSGTPFGRRFNRAMAPIRLILAISLLTPLSYGYNGAQHLAFRVAKLGSGMATNGWIEFNNVLVGASVTPGGMPANLVTLPNAPAFNSFLEFMHVVHTCKYMEEWVNRRDTDGNNVADTIQAYQVRDNQAWLIPVYSGTADPINPGFTNNYPYATALGNANNEDIIVRFGIRSPQYANEAGNVFPFCGEIRFDVKSLRNAPPDVEGGYRIQEIYWDMFVFMVHDPLYDIDGRATAKRVTPTSWQTVASLPSAPGGTHKEASSPIPTGTMLQVDYIDWYNARISWAIEQGRLAQIADSEWMNYNTSLGWAGAAIWYNLIAQLNGGMMAAAYSIPVASLYPSTMEWVHEQRKADNAAVDGLNRFNPELSEGRMVEFQHPGDVYVALAGYYAQTFWPGMYVQPEGNAFTDTIQAIFGLEGLFNLVQNLPVHPIAQLAGVGRSLIESAVRNLMISFGSGLAGGLANMFHLKQAGSIGKNLAGFTMKIALLGLSLGFILYYVVPFLPFIYFFFAVGVWVKTIFEAMVGLPLWALAHVRIDGEGIPGHSAMNGYFLLLEIFLRPILTIFGLVASICIFMAQVQILHLIWRLVVTNLAGHDADYINPVTLTTSALPITPGETGSQEFFRDSIDIFFYMILYTIVVFMMAMASFKLIDLIPQNILRWIGSSVDAFSRYSEDSASQMVTSVYMGSQAAVGQMSSGMLGLMGRN